MVIGIPYKSKISKFFLNTKVGNLTTKSSSKMYSSIKNATTFWNIMGAIGKIVYFIFIGSVILVFLYLAGIVLFTKYEIIIPMLCVCVLFGIVAYILAKYSKFFESIFSAIAFVFRLVWNMTSALYHKYCPIIKWESKT